MQKDYRAPVCVFRGLDIHKTHPQILPLDKEIQIGSRIRIFQLLETRSERLFVPVRKKFLLGANCSRQQSCNDDGDERSMQSHISKYGRTRTPRQAQACGALRFYQLKRIVSGQPEKSRKALARLSHGPLLQEE